MGVGVKEAHGQILHMVEEVGSDGVQRILRDLEHYARIAERAEHTRDIYARKEGKCLCQRGKQLTGDAAADEREQVIVRYALDEICARHSRCRAHCDEQEYKNEQEFGLAEVAEQPCKGRPDILWLLKSVFRRCHYATLPSCCDL